MVGEISILDTERGAIAGVILCGGKSSRFGSNKNWHEVDGKPLIVQAIDALRPQTGSLWLGCKQPSPRLAALGVPLVTDLPQYDGPLAALATSLEHAQQHVDALLSLPVDCYPVPDDLAARLSQALNGASIAIATSQGRAQYTIGLWRTELVAMAMDCLRQGQRSMRDLLQRTSWIEVEFPQLRNINYRNDAH